MDLTTFFENFETIAEAPGGIDKLRSLVLDLAVRGQLVPHKSNDLNAQAEVSQISTRLKAQQKSGEIRKQKKPLPLPENLPYKLYQNWVWVRFVEIASIDSKLVTPDEFREFPHIAPNHIEKDRGKLLPYQTVEEDAVKSSKQHFFPGQILYSKIRPNLNKAVIVDFEGLCSADMYPISTGLYPRYFLLFILSQPFIKQVTSGDNRLAMPKVNQEQLSQVLIAVPPIAEQKRIVAKVDELMALCDRLQEAQEKRDRDRKKLRASALDALMNAPTDKDLNQAWAFVRDRWDDLNQQPEDVKEMRSLCLDLAIRGELSILNKSKTEIQKLLEEFHQEKARLIKEKKLKKTKTLAPISEEEKIIPIPMSWSWVKLDELSFVTKLAGFEYTKFFNLQDFGEIPVIRAQNVRMGRLDTTNLKYIDLETSINLERSALNKPAILMTFIGAGIGDVSIFNFEDRWHLAPNVAKIEPFNNFGEKLDLHYLLFFLMSPVGRQEIFKSKKSTAQPSISMGTIRDINVVLPPLQEQKNIVSQIQKMLPMCDRLENSLRQSQEKASALASAAIANLEV